MKSGFTLLHRRFAAFAAFAATALITLSGAALPAQLWSGGSGIELRVNDRSGRPVAGATVLLLYLQTEPASGPGAVLTDGKGMARLGGLAEGPWRLRIDHPSHMSFVGVVSLRRNKKPDLGSTALEKAGDSFEPLRVKVSKYSGPGSSLPAPPAVAQAPAPSPSTAPPPQPGVVVEPAPRPDAEAPDAETPAVQPRPEPTPAIVEPSEVLAAAAAAEKPTPVAPTAPTPEPATIEPARDAVVAPATGGGPEIEAAPTVSPEPAAPLAEAPAREAAESVAAAPEPFIEAPEESAPDLASAEPPAAPDPLPSMAEAPIAEPPATEFAATERAVDDPTITQPTGDQPSVSQPPVTAPSAVAPETVVPEADSPATSTPGSSPSASSGTMAEVTLPAPESAPRVAAARRSFDQRSCPECRPGELALSVEQVAAPAAAGCSAVDTEAIDRAIEQLHAEARSSLRTFSGPALSSSAQSALDTVEPHRRLELVRSMGNAANSSSGCQAVMAVLPRGSRYIGFRYEARDEVEEGECLGDRPCSIGDAHWLDNPVVKKMEKATFIYGVFRNDHPERARSGRLTVYYAPAGGRSR